MDLRTFYGKQKNAGIFFQKVPLLQSWTKKFSLTFSKSRSLITSFNSSCVIPWVSLNWRSAVKSASVDAEGSGVFSQFSVGSSSESKIYCCNRNREVFSVRYRSNSRQNIRIIDSLLFFLCNSLLKWWNYTKIAVCQMVGWFPPHHGKDKSHWTPFDI